MLSRPGWTKLAEAVQHAVIAKIRQVVSEVGHGEPSPVATRARRQASTSWSARTR
ncbi:MAG: hypothetical protein ACRDOI_05210 [Trebonia sp.]